LSRSRTVTREAAGRGTDIEAIAARQIDSERLQRVAELDATARDEAGASIDQQFGVRLDQPPLSHNSVDSRLRHGCNGTSSLARSLRKDLPDVYLLISIG